MEPTKVLAWNKSPTMNIKHFAAIYVRKFQSVADMTRSRQFNAAVYASSFFFCMYAGKVAQLLENF